MIELIVELDPVRERDNYWSLVVRCVTDIKQSDRFSQAVPYKVEFDENRTVVNMKMEAAFEVDLIVDRIHSYEREWDIISGGMTAKIFVIGDASRIHGNFLLNGELSSPRRVRETDLAKFVSRPLS